MSKKRRRQRKDREQRRSLLITIESLEVVRGHDGFLRGKPEPVMMVAAYRALPSSVSLVGRLLLKPRLVRDPPCKLVLEGVELRYDTRPRELERFVLLALAVEQDSGEGVTALYETLEVPQALALWSLGEEVPAPRALGEWAPSVNAAPDAQPIELLVNARHAREVSASDDYISACALSLPIGERHDELWRLPFADEDGGNDWTATLRVQVS